MAQGPKTFQPKSGTGGAKGPQHAATRSGTMKGNRKGNADPTMRVQPPTGMKMKGKKR